MVTHQVYHIEGIQLLSFLLKVQSLFIDRVTSYQVQKAYYTILSKQKKSILHKSKQQIFKISLAINSFSFYFYRRAWPSTEISISDPTMFFEPCLKLLRHLINKLLLTGQSLVQASKSLA